MKITSELRASILRHWKAITSIGERPQGSEAAVKAEAYVESVLAESGFATRRAPFPSTRWKLEACELEADGAFLPALAGPYSPTVDILSAPIPASSLGELEAADCSGRILVLDGELSKTPVMPKAFDFYNPDEHRKLVALLGEKRPAAILAISPRENGVWPILDDPDLGIPSATIAATVGRAVLRAGGIHLRLASNSEPAMSATVSGFRERAGEGSRSSGAPERKRLLLCAHLDSKHYSPGSLDNGGSVAALLAFAESADISPWLGAGGVELAFFMGEECSAAGEKAWLGMRGGSVADIGLAVNCDGIGGNGATAISAFNLADTEAEAALALARQSGSFLLAEPWYESDHFLFWPSGIPTLALTSANPHDFDLLIHTPADRPELVDPGLLEETAAFLLSLRH